MDRDPVPHHKHHLVAEIQYGGMIQAWMAFWRLRYRWWTVAYNVPDCVACNPLRAAEEAGWLRMLWVPGERAEVGDGREDLA